MYCRIEPRLTQPTRNLLGRAHRRKCDQVYEAMYSAAAPAVRRPHTAAPVPVGRGSKVSEIGEEGGERGRVAGAGAPLPRPRPRFGRSQGQPHTIKSPRITCGHAVRQGTEGRRQRWKLEQAGKKRDRLPPVTKPLWKFSLLLVQMLFHMHLGNCNRLKEQKPCHWVAHSLCHYVKLLLPLCYI